jgi:hypothetical protein
MSGIHENSGFTGTLGKAGLGIGDGAKTGIGQAAPNGAGLDFAIDGIAYHKADSATNVPFSALALQADLTSCLYLVQINAAGTFSFKKGVEELTSGLTVDQPSSGLQSPAADEDNCPVGYVRIDCNGTTFTGGTDALDKASTTDTYVDFGAGMNAGAVAS